MESDIANALNKRIFEPFEDPQNSIYEQIYKVRELELQLMQKRHYIRNDYIHDKIMPAMRAAFDQ